MAEGADANGDQTIPPFRHTHGNGNEDQFADQDRDTNADNDNNTARFPDTHSNKYAAAARADINFRTVLSGRRAVQNSDTYSDEYHAANSDSDAGSAGNGNEHTVSDSDLYPHAITHAVSDSDLYRHADADTVSDCNLYPNAVAYTDTYADAHAISRDDEGGNAFPDADANLHSHAAAISIPVV